MSGLALLFPLLLTPHTRSQSDAAALYQKALPSIMRIESETPGGLSTGTGFLAIKTGLAITCWHVVKGAKKVTVKFSNGETFESTGVVDKDEFRDIAVIRVRVAGRPLLELGADPEVGQKAYVIGSPRGLDFSISDGLIGNVRELDGFRQYQFTAPASPGNSGSPLLNGEGKAIGVVSWGRKDGQNLNFATPAVYLQGLDTTLATTVWENVISKTVDDTPAETKAVNGRIGSAYRQLWKFASRLHIETEDVMRSGAQKASPLLVEELVRLQAEWDLLKSVSERTDAGQVVDASAGIIGLATKAGENLLECSALRESRNFDAPLAMFVAAFRLAEPNPSLLEALSAPSSSDLRSQVGEALMTKICAPKSQKGWKPGEMSRVSRRRFDGGYFLLARLAFDVDRTGYVFGFLVDPDNQARLVDVEGGTPPKQWGFRKGDIVKMVDETPVDSIEAMKQAILAKPDRSASVTVDRDGKASVLRINVRRFSP